VTNLLLIEAGTMQDAQAKTYTYTRDRMSFREI